MQRFSTPSTMPSKYSFSLMNADYVQLNKSWDYKNVSSPFYRLYLIDDGEGFVSTTENHITLEKGFLYLIPSYTLFNQSCNSFLSQYYIHIVEESPDGSSLFATNRKLMKVKATDTDLACMKNIIKLNPGRDLRKSDNPKVYEKSLVIKGFLEINDNQPLASLVETNGIILQLLSRFLSRHLYDNSRNHAHSPQIEDAICYIDANLNTVITVGLLANRANQSKDHFSRLFHKKTGLSPLDYINHKRIQRAQFLLVTTALPLSVITEEAGFESRSYFTRIFKKITSVTPKQYQHSHNQII